MARGPFVQPFEDPLCLRTGQLGDEIIECQLPQPRDAPKAAQQFLGGALAHAGDFDERCPDAALRASLAVKGDGKAMCLVANLLDQMQDR